MAAGQLTNALRHVRRLLGGPGGSDLNDRELLGRFAEFRDQEAFATLVRRHGPVVLGVCRRVLDNEHDAEDAFQATFLVLARKARSVHWRESVANWLYEVAYRTAQRARSRRGLRQQHERQAAAMQTSECANGVGWQELRQVLDDELMYLPEKYRMPLLLCYLHGKSREEAAQELGWTLQQLKGSLERGKEFLRGRLDRRGLSLSAALLATLLSANAVCAVPATLLTNTIQSATTAAPAVAALAEGVIQAMFWKKAKLVAFVVLTLSALGSGGFMAFRAGPGQSGPAALAAPLPEPAVKNLPENIRGQKVLLDFAFNGSAARGQSNTKAEDIRAALKKAGVELVEVVTEEERSDPVWRYYARILLDCKGKAPAEALAGLPCRLGGIVFRDGDYQQGLANPEATAKQKDHVPAPYACHVLPNLLSGKKDDLAERLRGVAGIRLQGFPPPPASGGGSGWVKLTPEEGKRTLLEVFLLSKAGFKYVDPQEVPRQKGDAAEPAWGEPKNGIRVGLAPQQLTVKPDAESMTVQVFYENVSKEVREVPMHAGANMYQLMFRGEKDAKPFYVGYLVDRLALAPVRMVKVKPGERVQEEFKVPFGKVKPALGWTGLPDVASAESITLQVGLCSRGDPSTEEHWKADDTLKSGAISVRRETDGGGDVSWGEAVDGVRIGLSPWRLELAEGERPLKIQVWFENVGKEAAEVPIDLPASVGLSQFMFAGEKSGKSFDVTFDCALQLVAPRTQKVLAGQRVSMPFGNALTGSNKIGFAFPDLAVGEAFTIRAAWYKNGTFNKPAGKEHWNQPSTPKSGPITVERKGIVAKASEPAVKDGLAVTLKMHKPVFALGEAPGFDVVFENRSTKAFQIVIGWRFVCDFTWVSLNDKSSWQIMPWRSTATPPPTIVSLDPGKLHAHRITLDRPLLVNGKGPRDQLASGKYSLSGALAFQEWTDKNQVPYWTGQITTNPVEFEIAAEKPAVGVRLTDQQMAALALETAKKGRFQELQEIRSQNPHLGGKWLLEQPLTEHRFWCVVHAFTPAAPARSYLAVSRTGKVIFPFQAKDFASLVAAEDRSKWTDEQYLQAAALYIHLTGTPHQDGWKMLHSAKDFMAIKFNMAAQNEKKREEAAKSIEKARIVRDKDTVGVRLWAWHLIGGGLREWTVEFTAKDFKADFKEQGRFGGGGYD